MGNETEKREWDYIMIHYTDGSRESVNKATLDEIEKLMPMLNALDRAKHLKEKLENLLK